MGYLQEAENISIHAPTRGATYTADVIGLRCGFQSTLPRGERHAHLRQSCCSHDFNPRSHEGSDRFKGEIINIMQISIHAPTRGATVRFFNVRDQFRISIHAPTRGATVKAVECRCRLGFQSTLPRGERLDMSERVDLIQRDFNPRSHEGSDRYERFCTPKAKISIHAPTRGATFCVDHIRSIVRFQSTLPRGERRSCISTVTIPIPYFNPRSHEGSDLCRMRLMP